MSKPITLDDLPPLPEGCHYEISRSSVHVVHIEWPDKGAVSIDLDERVFNLGWTSAPRRGFAAQSAGCAESYVGRGWRDTLIRDAVAAFRRAVQTTPNS